MSLPNPHREKHMPTIPKEKQKTVPLRPRCVLSLNFSPCICKNSTSATVEGVFRAQTVFFVFFGGVLNRGDFI